MKNRAKESCCLVTGSIKYKYSAKGRYSFYRPKDSQTLSWFRYYHTLHRETCYHIPNASRNHAMRYSKFWTKRVNYCWCIVRQSQRMAPSDKRGRSLTSYPHQHNVKTWCCPQQNQKWITYCTVVRGGLGHLHWTYTHSHTCTFNGHFWGLPM